MKVLAIVPAKLNSRRLDQKNVRYFPRAGGSASNPGVPLFARAVDAAMAGGCERVIVSSPDREVLEIARNFDADTYLEGARYPDLRTLRNEIVRDEAEYNRKWDAVMMLLPTFPFRSRADVARCIGLLESGHASVQSAVYIERTGLYLPNSYIAADPLDPDGRRLLYPTRPPFKTYLEIDKRRAIDIDDGDDWAAAVRLADVFDWNTGEWRDQ